MARIDAFLKLGASQGCSDVHLAVGVPPMLRMNGELMPIKFRSLRRSGARGLRHRDPDARRSRSSSARATTSTSRTSLTTATRFRVNVFRKDTGVGAVFRPIPADVPSLDSLNLPPVVKKFCDYHQGMVLVTGSDRHRQVDHARGDDRSPEPARGGSTSSASKTRSSSSTAASSRR